MPCTPFKLRRAIERAREVDPMTDAELSRIVAVIHAEFDAVDADRGGVPNPSPLQREIARASLMAPFTADQEATLAFVLGNELDAIAFTRGGLIPRCAPDGTAIPSDQGRVWAELGG